MTTLNPKFATVVFSGGQDSTTCLAWALDRYDKVQCVTFNYGQKHAREIEAAKEVISFFEDYYSHDTRHNKIDHITVEIGPILAGSSPLTNKSEQLETYSSHDEMENIIGDRVEKTFVPMRNAVFLMLAANQAVAAGSGVLVTGVCQADNANYPDCRESFIDAADAMANLALGLENAAFHNQLNIDTPLMDLSKAESVKLACSLPGGYPALAYSHTAYSGEYPPITQDHATVLRAHGFEEAGMPDPLIVRAWGEDLIELPESGNYDILKEGDSPITDEPHIGELIAYLCDKRGLKSLEENLLQNVDRDK